MKQERKRDQVLKMKHGVLSTSVNGMMEGGPGNGQGVLKGTGKLRTDPQVKMCML